MSTAIQSRPEPKTTSETAQRRWRLAALLGLATLLALGGLIVVLLEQSAQASRTMPVLRATRDIQAGTVITFDEVAITSIRADDSSVVANLVPASDRDRLVGQVAVDGVRAGSLIPAGLGASEATAALWDVPLPVKRLPPDLKVGDHVAVLVSGTDKSGAPAELVAAQDVRVLAVQRDTVDLWLPASSAAQMELYASRGEMVLAKMQPGAVQKLPSPGPH
jgi:SAF domain-containing protein